MIITDLLEYDGKNVEVHLFDGNIVRGIMQYIPSYCAIFHFRKPKHFYIENNDGEWAFRAWHVESIKEINNG